MALDTSGNVTEDYMYGVNRERKLSDSEYSYFISDSQGSIVLHLDDEGNNYTNNPSWYRYDAYGQSLTGSSSSNQFRYRGEFCDNETGFIYLRGRYYNPDTGSFISEDPVKDGSNWYAYCGGDPVNFVDPSGCTFCIAWSYSTDEAKEYVDYYNKTYKNEDSYRYYDVYTPINQWSDFMINDFSKKSSFARAALTKKNELLNMGIPESDIDVQRIDNLEDLKITWNMWKNYESVEEVHIYSHGYPGAAEVTGGSGNFWNYAEPLNYKTTLREVKTENKVVGRVFTPYIVFYGCYTAKKDINGNYPIQNIANRQGVTIYGQRRSSSFSKSFHEKEKIEHYGETGSVYLFDYEYLWLNYDGLGAKFNPQNGGL